MKQTLLVLALLVGFSSFAQTLNQFDADGKRHGKWKKNFDGTDVIRYEGTFEHGINYILETGSITIVTELNS